MNLAQMFPFIVMATGDSLSEIYETMSMLMSDQLLGILIFLFFLIFTFVLGLGMVIGSVVLIPSLFLVFDYIPDLRIFVAIFLGLIVGLGLHKFINR